VAPVRCTFLRRAHGSLHHWSLTRPDHQDGSNPGLQRTLRALVAGTTHLVGLVEADGTVIFVSPSVAPLLGHEPEDLVGTNALSLVHPDDLGMALSMLGASGPDPAGVGLRWDDADLSGNFRLRHADGRWIPFELVRNDFRADPGIGGVLVIGRAVVARQAFDEALATLARDDDGRQALTKLVRYLDVRIPGTRSAVLLAGIEGSWATEGVPAGLLVPGGPWSDLTPADEGIVLVDLLAPGDTMVEPLRQLAVSLGFRGCWCLPLPIRRAQVYSPLEPGSHDTPVLGCLVVWSERDQEPTVGHLGVMERVGGLADVVLRRRAAAGVLRDLVARDQLTGALSRAGFEGLSAAEAADPSTLLVIDLDDFKEINDRFGHPAGDQALRLTAERIQSLLAPGDSLGRMGGDEFILRLGGSDLARAVLVAKRILGALEVPVTLGDHPCVVQVSIGIAAYDPTCTPSDLLGRADAAMYAAKQAGKACWRIWGASTDPSDRATARA
jgi:diguanylate cyclase (GGDEF)-like protein/PAS domain S-box-containing protein